MSISAGRYRKKWKLYSKAEYVICARATTMVEICTDAFQRFRGWSFNINRSVRTRAKVTEPSTQIRAPNAMRGATCGIREVPDSCHVWL